MIIVKCNTPYTIFGKAQLPGKPVLFLTSKKSLTPIHLSTYKPSNKERPNSNP